MATPLRLLVLEDQQTDAELMVAELRGDAATRSGGLVWQSPQI